MHDYYAVLGVGREASLAEIKAAYRRLAMRWHPDKNPDDPRGAAKRFRAIHEAYAVLSDARSRREYDARRGAALSTYVREAASTGASFAESAARMSYDDFLRMLAKILEASVGLLALAAVLLAEVAHATSRFAGAKAKELGEALDDHNRQAEMAAAARERSADRTEPWYVLTVLILVVTTALCGGFWSTLGAYSLLIALGGWLAAGWCLTRVEEIHAEAGGAPPSDGILIGALARLRRSFVSPWDEPSPRYCPRCSHARDKGNARCIKCGDDANWEDCLRTPPA